MSSAVNLLKQKTTWFHPSDFSVGRLYGIRTRDPKRDKLVGTTNSPNRRNVHRMGLEPMHIAVKELRLNHLSNGAYVQQTRFELAAPTLAR